MLINKLKCTKCNLFKFEEDFYIQKSKKRGRKSQCKECESLFKTGKKYLGKRGTFLRKAIEFEDGTKLCTLCNKIKNKNLFELKSKSKLGTYRSWCKDCDGLKHQALKYKIPIDLINKMYEEQNNCCKICGKKDNTNRRLAIDHCHTTNKIRSLLCNHCNTGLGKFKDDIELLQKAIDYIKEHK